MVTYIKSFTRSEATFSLFNTTTNSVEKEVTLEGDFSQYAHGLANTNDVRIWDNGIDADDIHVWNYPVPSYQNRIGRREMRIIMAYKPFGEPDLTEVTTIW